MLKSTALGVMLSIMFSVSANAQTCTENFRRASGNVSTWQVFPGLDPAKAIDKLARAGRNSGFWASVDVDRDAGIIRAENDGADNGRTQAVTITAKRQGRGTRIDYSIRLEPGQAPGNGFYSGICKFLSNAAH